MSKLNVNDKVIVKETGKVGVIKGRDIVTLPNNKIRVEYVVKTGEGFTNWDVYKKHELEKVKPVKKQKVLPSIVVDGPDGYKVTLVALVKRENVWKDAFDKDGFYAPYFRKGKDLSIGYAIYNPSDVYSPEIGIKIATHRAKRSPFCHLVSDFGGEFNKETINAILKCKGEYIVKNLKDFI